MLRLVLKYFKYPVKNFFYIDCLSLSSHQNLLGLSHFCFMQIIGMTINQLMNLNLVGQFLPYHSSHFSFIIYCK